MCLRGVTTKKNKSLSAAPSYWQSFTNQVPLPRPAAHRNTQRWKAKPDVRGRAHDPDLGHNREGASSTGNWISRLQEDLRPMAARMELGSLLLRAKLITPEQ